jgi:hypothetical protein
MSLTSLLEADEVRRRFREEFEKPDMEARPEREAPVVTDRPAHVGTAFDYLLRFHIRHLNPETARGRPWTAGAALRLLSGKQKEEAQKVIQRAKTARDDYVTSGEAPPGLIKAVLGLARLDVVVRTKGSVDISGVEAVAEGDVDDLQRLHEIIPSYCFGAEDHCVLNPTFGKASLLAGGADADLLIDDALIEIKTVKDATFERSMLDQLLGYYTLHVIAGVDGLDEKPKIQRIGVYFSRHAHLHLIDLDEIVDRSTYPDFVEWFAKYCMQRQARPGSGRSTG